MQRKPLFLVAAVAELARFLALAFLAEALGGLRSGTALPLFFRYLAAPQLLFAAAFFFLWFDPSRYAAYRPLALLGKGLSVLASLPLLVGLLRLTSGATLVGPEAAPASLVAVGVDLFGLLVLATAGRGGRGVVEAPPDEGPKGPESIEKVEG
jgi:hypothetical protein